MRSFKENLDAILDAGVTSVNDVCNILDIPKNDLFAELQTIGGYSTAGISSDHGTITRLNE